jgi:hypothetical protein
LARPTCPALAEKRGAAEFICHFFLRFFGFGGFLSLQGLAVKWPALIPTLQNKSCLKTYRKFFCFLGSVPKSGREC